nr:hypothetical protein [Olsenella uli]
MREDLQGMLALPGTGFGSARRGKAHSDKCGYVRVEGSLYRAGPS